MAPPSPYQVQLKRLAAHISREVREQWVQVERVAHQLKGTCSYIAAGGASAAAKHLQNTASVYSTAADGNARVEARAAIVDAWRALSDAIARTRADVRAYLNEAQSADDHL